MVQGPVACQLARISDDQFAKFIYIKPISGGLVVTTVCRRWRRVALGSAALWDYVVVNSDQEAHGTLAASKQAPLDVYCTLSDGDGLGVKKDALELIIQEIHRLRSFVLSVPKTDYFYKPSIIYATARVPLLESISIHHFSLHANDKNILRKISHK